MVKINLKVVYYSSVCLYDIGQQQNNTAHARYDN